MQDSSFLQNWQRAKWKLLVLYGKSNGASAASGIAQHGPTLK
jgi:hypothetical protein